MSAVVRLFCLRVMTKQLVVSWCVHVILQDWFIRRINLHFSENTFRFIKLTTSPRMRPRVRPWTKYFNIVTVWQSSKVALAFSKKVPLAGYSVVDYREGPNSNDQNVHFEFQKFILLILRQLSTSFFSVFFSVDHRELWGGLWI